MTGWVALVRAVNVGGTGKLPSADLKAACEAAGFVDVRTYLASGNAVFTSDLDEAAVCRALIERLTALLGRPAGVLVRDAAEMARVAAANPFADEAGNRVVALFTDEPLPETAEDGVTHLDAERLALGERAIYIAYGNGMAASKLKVPAAKAGTARNMNTVAKLAEMAAAPGERVDQPDDGSAGRR